MDGAGARGRTEEVAQARSQGRRHQATRKQELMRWREALGQRHRRPTSSSISSPHPCILIHSSREKIEEGKETISLLQLSPCAASHIFRLSLIFTSCIIDDVDVVLPCPVQGPNLAKERDPNDVTSRPASPRELHKGSPSPKDEQQKGKRHSRGAQLPCSRRPPKAQEAEEGKGRRAEGDGGTVTAPAAADAPAPCGAAGRLRAPPRRRVGQGGPHHGLQDRREVPVGGGGGGGAGPAAGVGRRGAVDDVPVGGHHALPVPLGQPAPLRQHAQRLQLQVLTGLPQLSRATWDVRRRGHQQLHGPALHLRGFPQEFIQPDGEPDVPGALRGRRAPAAARWLRGGRGRQHHHGALVPQEGQPAPRVGR